MTKKIKGNVLRNLYLTPRLEKLSKATSQEQRLKLVYEWVNTNKIDFGEFIELLSAALEQ